MNNRGYRYPLLLAGCTGCRACAQICPDFVFQVYKYDTPIQLEVHRRSVVTTLDVTAAPTRELLEGSEAIAAGDDRRRVPVLRRLPDDAVHRSARGDGEQARRRSTACA